MAKQQKSLEFYLKDDHQKLSDAYVVLQLPEIQVSGGIPGVL